MSEGRGASESREVDQGTYGGREFAALVRRLMQETGADFYAVIEAMRRHGKDEQAAREELSRNGLLAQRKGE